MSERKGREGRKGGNGGNGGKLETALLDIQTTLDGSDWLWMGERARHVLMNFGLTDGLYFARNINLIKTTGEIRGNIEFNTKNDDIKWDGETTHLTLADIDFIDRLEIPVRSKIELKTNGSGSMEHIKSKTECRFTGTEIKGETLDPSSFNMEMGESNLRANLNIFGDSLQSQLKYSLIAKQPSNFKMDLKHFDFSPVLLMVNPKLLDDQNLKGNVDGKIQLDFLNGQLELARGSVVIQNYELTKTNFFIRQVDPIDVPIQLGYFHFPATRFRFKNSEIKVGGEGKKGDVDLSITGGVDLSVAELFTSSVLKAEGIANTDVRIKGPLKNIKINGDATFTNAKLMLRWMQSPLAEMDGALHLRQSQIFIDNVEAYLGDEVFSANGKIETFVDRFPELDIHAQFEDNKVKMAPFTYIQVRGNASIKGSRPPYTIGGNLEVPQALWAKSFSSNGAGNDGRGERFAPKDEDNQTGNNLFALDLNVNAPQGFFVKNEIIDAEFKGKVRLVGPPDSPKLLGEGQSISGKVLFRDRPFVFESVKIDFDDPYQLNPKFKAIAVSDINQYKIRVLANGRTNSWKAEFSSSPFLPENDIYSLLASGLTSGENSRYKLRDRSYVSQGEAASLILHSLDFSKDVQNKTGLQFEVEEAIDQQYASSIFRPQTIGENVASPKVVIKRPVGKVVFAFGSTVGVGTENERDVSAEYGLTKGMSVLGVWSDISEQDTRDTRTSFGLDLKFNKKFK